MRREHAGAARRRIGHATTVVPIAVAAIALVASPASAATGDLRITSPGKPSVVVHDPSPGCRTIAAAFPAGTVVHNGTDSHLRLYRTSGCTGGIPADLAPGASTAFAPASIYVMS